MTPYYQRGGAAIYQGDCRCVLHCLADDVADAVITDPPYGQTNEAYDTDIATRPDVWVACRRVCVSNSAILSFAGSPTYHRIASAIEAGGWRVRQMWAWVYRDGMIASAYPREGFDRLAPAFDPICFATRGKCLLPLEREGGEEWRRSARSGRAFSSRSCDLKTATSGSGHWPKSLASDGSPPFEYFAYRRAQADDVRTDHPNQKPIALMMWLVGKLPAGVILDPFAGSGTTGVAALSLGRRFIGIETNERYCEIAAKRIDAVFDSAPLLPVA